jgi:catechol 2,3-dioxygenase
MHKFHQPPLVYIDQIALQVHDPKRMVAFYTSLGMTVLSQTATETTLGTKEPLLILKHDRAYPIETQPTQGLYHVAYLLPNQEALASLLKYLLDQKFTLQGLSDHGVSEAIYLADPEGNGIELYCDRPKLLWPYEQQHLAMVTERMNIQRLLSLAKPFQTLPEDTIIGHLHLHVGDVNEARRYYQQVFDYQLTQMYGNQAAFLSSGSYHHHLGINTWLGEKIPKKNPETTGLVSYRIHQHQKPTIQDIAGLWMTYHD